MIKISFILNRFYRIKNKLSFTSHRKKSKNIFICSLFRDTNGKVLEICQSSAVMFGET